MSNSYVAICVEGHIWLEEKKGYPITQPWDIPQFCECPMGVASLKLLKSNDMLKGISITYPIRNAMHVTRHYKPGEYRYE